MRNYYSSEEIDKIGRTCFVHGCDLEVHFIDSPYFVCRKGHHFSIEYNYARTNGITIEKAVREISLLLKRTDLIAHTWDFRGILIKKTPVIINNFHESPSYWHTRGISQKTLKIFNAGILDFMPAIPFCDINGNIIGYYIRYPMIPDNTPILGHDQKCCHLPINDNWQLDHLHCPPVPNILDFVVIVEGIVDVMKCYDAGYWAVAINGALLSPAQIAELLQITKKLIIFTDNDHAGKAILKQIPFLKTFFEVSIISTDKEKDPGIMSLVTIQQEIEHGRTFE